MSDHKLPLHAATYNWNKYTYHMSDHKLPHLCQVLSWRPFYVHVKVIVCRPSYASIRWQQCISLSPSNFNITCHYYALVICLLSWPQDGTTFLWHVFREMFPSTLTQSPLRIVNDVSMVVILRQSLPCGSSSPVAGARFVLKALAGFPSSAYILQVLQLNQATKVVCD